mmetsp:Transcript_64202/g.74627  ORF Transcript_64202/g.74627 Transcript_64202/m.74627 type:complete len:197 (+) Transcript_64202:50-640(+)
MLATLSLSRKSSNTLGDYKIKRKDKIESNLQQQTSEKPSNSKTSLKFETESAKAIDDKVFGAHTVKKVRKDHLDQSSLSSRPSSRSAIVPDYGVKDYHHQLFGKKHDENHISPLNTGNAYKPYAPQSNYQRRNSTSHSKGKTLMTDAKIPKVDCSNKMPVEFSTQRLFSNLMSTTPYFKCNDQIIMVLPKVLTAEL